MSNHQIIYDYLVEKLVEWKHKDSNGSVAGIGFNKDNIYMFEPTSLPSTPIFDLVQLSTPITNSSALTTGSSTTTASTETYTIEVYTKRAGQGNAGKTLTVQATIENTQFITNLFQRLGFIITTPQAEFNYANVGCTRQIINITRKFIT